MVAAYIAKYSVKAADDFGRTGRILSQMHAQATGLRPHVVQMITAAEELAEVAVCYAGVGRWLHMLGFRGHFASKSRRFSVTLGALRQSRRDWYTSRPTLETPAPVPESSLVVGEWEFLGVGYLSAGDAALAASLGRAARESRDLRKDLQHNAIEVSKRSPQEVT